MSKYPIIQLKKGKETSPQRFHPWIFSGAMQSFDVNLKDGDIVEIVDYKNNFLCIGHFYHGSIAIKILTFKQEEINQDFWNHKIKQAFLLRKNLGLVDNKSTNCFRLIHAEGDNCAGLIIDIYDTTAVIQCHSIGMHRSINEIKNAIENEVIFIDTIYDKSAAYLPKEYANELANHYLKGEQKEIIAIENNNKFLIDIEHGQKTGFFLDQRDNRNLLAHYCKDKNVLNTYCYSGGFSIYALNNQAKEVVSIDSSKIAMELVGKNIEINFNTGNKNHYSICDDVFHFFKISDLNFDVIILDPPAFAKNIAKRHNAVQAYKRLNAEGFKRINKGGIIFTFSCSQVVDKELFYATVMSAAIEANRDVKILHYLSQPADHPINIFHPEGSYLKGLVLYVD
ncbi:MAG: class I SAM-dependent rRNA methyltransferase [Saprospirales bacterium]|nr:class I SAM-dependent rRNA methyltransferase [Saprospirales bacterium]